MINRQIKQLKDDIALTLVTFPNFDAVLHEKPHFYLIGDYTVMDNENVPQDTFRIKILIPKQYPYQFPILYELSNKITPRTDDRHISHDGQACVDLPHRLILKSIQGITICEFVENYVHRYLCWQILYNLGERDMQSWLHGDYGTIEYYYELFRSQDNEVIIKCLTASLIPLPGRNDPCPCLSGIKFKNCHESELATISQLGKEQIKKDLMLFINLENLQARNPII